jgi:hypothetical protein
MVTESELRFYIRGFEEGARLAGLDLPRIPPAVPPKVQRAKPKAHAAAPAAGRPAGTGSRQQAILEALAAAVEEGSVLPTTVELANIMGSDVKYLYRALPILLRQGKVRCYTTSVEGVDGVLEPGTDVTEARHLLGVAPRWSIATTDNTKER